MADVFSSSSNTGALYRLRGTVDDIERTIDLAPGEYTVGSAPSSDIVLPFSGVSRHHARLELRGASLVVEDLGSKNGTRIDGSRVAHGPLPVGAEICFGSVCLQVERVVDEGLAIVFDEPGMVAGQPIAPPTPAEDTTYLAAESTGDRTTRWLQVMSGLVERLAVSAEDLTQALSFLGERLAVVGCCAVQWTDDAGAVALAAWGTVGEIPRLSDVRGAARPVPGIGGGVGCALFDQDPPLSAAYAENGRPDPLGLLVWGEFEDRRESAAFLATLLGLLERLVPRLAEEREPGAGRYPELAFPERYQPGLSPPMAALYGQMQTLLHSDVPVLIHGETGVGKEMVAQILHASSSRRGGPFVAVNCAAIPSDLLEAEMFGIGKDVATGVSARRGRFESAQGGTIFLDEIGEMAPSLQAKLLRVLQEKEINPLGSSPRAIDVRVVSATNVDLAQHIEQGSLRSDLYYRLAGFVLEVPTLRQCSEDVPGLVEHFLRLFAAETGIRIRGVTVEALQRLKQYAWPGNIRELEHEIRRLVHLSANGGVITSERLSEKICQTEQDDAPIGRLVGSLASLDLPEAVAALEQHLIREALRRTQGNKSEACRLLGLSRNGLKTKMTRLDL